LPVIVNKKSALLSVFDLFFKKRLNLDFSAFAGGWLARVLV